MWSHSVTNSLKKVSKRGSINGREKNKNCKNLTVDVVLAELTEKVLAASNGAQRRAVRKTSQISKNKQIVQNEKNNI